MKIDVLIIGGGPAGLESAASLHNLGISSIIIERNSFPGGHLLEWDRLFPDGEKASDVLNKLLSQPGTSNIITSSTINSIKKCGENDFFTTLENGDIIESKSIILATGFDLFNATKKLEYGYGLFKSVITNSELELYFKGKKSFGPQSPEKVCFVHCVGSRDEKASNRHCSKVCCITAVKQAIELKEIFPDSEIYCFYMDLRMFGRGYEDIYLKAQVEHGIRFIRGRVSEISENEQGKAVIKAEDTLSSRPIKISMDLVVLMTGIVPDTLNNSMIDSLSIEKGEDGFINPLDFFTESVSTNQMGVFTAGCVTGPKNLPEVFGDAHSVALKVKSYLNV